MMIAIQKPVYTVATFCSDHHVSRSLLYKLFAEGKGPKVFRVGRRTLISAEAAAIWRQQMEAATDQGEQTFCAYIGG